jgi:hypothetical protein
MLYDEWLRSLHPRTRDIYERFSASYLIQPKYVVFSQQVIKSSPAGVQIYSWLDARCKAEWVCVGPSSEEAFNLVGFLNADDAAIFKLIYGFTGD